MFGYQKRSINNFNVTNFWLQPSLIWPKARVVMSDGSFPAKVFQINYFNLLPVCQKSTPTFFIKMWLPTSNNNRRDREVYCKHYKMRLGNATKSRKTKTASAVRWSLRSLKKNILRLIQNFWSKPFSLDLVWVCSSDNSITESWSSIMKTDGRKVSGDQTIVYYDQSPRRFW